VCEAIGAGPGVTVTHSDWRRRIAADIKKNKQELLELLQTIYFVFSRKIHPDTRGLQLKFRLASSLGPRQCVVN